MLRVPKEYFQKGKLKQYFFFVKSSTPNLNLEAAYGLIYDSMGNKIDEIGDSIMAKNKNNLK